MEEIVYKNIIVRPRIETFDEWVENMVNNEVGKWLKDKQWHMEHPCVHNDWRYNKTETEYRSESEKMYRKSPYLYWERQTHWFANFPNGRVVRIPKKKYSEDNDQFNARLDKVIAKVERENRTEYGKFTALMQKLVQKKIGGAYWLVYPTTYGIGLEAIYNWNFDKHSQAIKDILDSMGVEYYNEYSDAAWVYRYKISKKEANRVLIDEKINN